MAERAMNTICIRWLRRGDVTRVCWLCGGNHTTGIKERASTFDNAIDLAVKWQAKLGGAALVYVQCWL